MTPLQSVSTQLASIAERHGLSADAQAELLALVLNQGGAVPMVFSQTTRDNGETWVVTPSPTSAPPDLPPPDTERYEPRELLGRGGMGQVNRALDRQLNRLLAMKVLRADLGRDRDYVLRFMEEAQVTAQLQHPGVVPIHELGRLPDGRPFFTMPEVVGRTLTEIVKVVRTRPDELPEWNQRRLLDAMLKACETVAFAHSRRVLHRDLKPDNIMVGSFGEVLVMDWGLAKVMGSIEHGSHDARPTGDGNTTMVSLLSEPHESRAGVVIGTPAFMSPEQARGEELGPPADVYALGATLFFVLTGQPPYGRDAGRELLRRVRSEAPDLSALSNPNVQPELAELVYRALERDPARRYAHASELVSALRNFLEGAKRREQSQAIVNKARVLRPQILELRMRARSLRRRAGRDGERVRPDSPLDAKRALWALEDEANRLERDAEFRQEEMIQLLHTALNYEPEQADAHELLAEHFRAQHAEAESSRDTLAAELLEMRLRAHDRGRHRAYLRGVGTLSLHTEPPAAEAVLYGWKTEDRRLIPFHDRRLGRTPIEDYELPIGSYVVRIRATGYAELSFPVRIGRQEHWDTAPPGSTAPAPIQLLTSEELGEDERLVSAGWFSYGGDPEAPHGVPGGRAWVDAFVIRTFPVTHGEYLHFLNTLVDEGREDEALRHALRERDPLPGEPGPMAYGRDKAGHFHLRPDAQGELWDPDWPVFLVSWHQARAYAAWLAARTGQSWRLPSELEWEKAGRGVDGRLFPWGDFPDPSFCCMQGSRPGPPRPAPVQSFPIDESVYGVRGLAGNVREWTLDLDEPKGTAGPAVAAGRALLKLPPEEPDAALYAVTRGGSWFSTARYARLAGRSLTHPSMRNNALGFRLARSVAAPKAQR